MEEKDILKNVSLDLDVSNHGDNKKENMLLIPCTKQKDEEEGEINLQQEQQDHRCVSGTCIICLNSYNIGDTVAWSGNQKCPHAFHQNCIFSWLLNSKEMECPCCRRIFVYCPTQ